MREYALTSTFRIFTTLAFIALTAANVTLAQVPPANGLTVFPMVGITGAQTLHLNLVAFPPNPCSSVTLGFQNHNGVAVGPRETTGTLEPGQSLSLDLNGSTLVGADQRVELLPTVAGINGKATGPGCIASAEVIENANGATVVLAPGAVGYPPSPAFGLLGVTSFQTARLNVVAFPPDPCIGTITWDNNAGAQIGTSLAVQLSAGEATHLDLPGGGALGERAEVRPVVEVTGGACIASAEIYTNATGATSAVYFPPTPCASSSTSCVAF